MAFDPSGSSLEYGSDSSRGRKTMRSSKRSQSGTTQYLAPRQLEAQMRNVNQFQNAQFDPYRQYGDAMSRGAYQGLMGQGDMAGQYGQNMMGRGAAFAGRAQQGFHQLRQYAMGENPMLNNQINQLGQDIGQNLNRNIMPGINAGFQNAGQRGSSRQGIAQGLAAQGAQQQFQRGATGLRSNAYNQGMEASNMMMQGGLQGAGQAWQTGADLMGQGSAAYAATAPMAQNVADIQQFRYNAQFQPFQVGAEVIGDPTALTRSRSRSWERAGYDQFSRSSGNDYGIGL